MFNDESKKIISYYSTCNYSVAKASIATSFGFPLGQIPATLIGRLAVDVSVQGQGYGEITLVEALKQIRTISKISACALVVVDALNPQVVAYYQRYGFITFDDDALRLFITMAAIDKL